MYKHILSLVLCSAFLVGCTATPSNDQSNPVDLASTSSSTSAAGAEGVYKVEVLEFQTGNKWKYTVEGEMPTPCHRFEVMPIVLADSEPERVELRVNPRIPGNLTGCTQVITKQKVSGSFQATSAAVVTLEVR